MTSITQDMRHHLSLLQYAQKYGVTKAARKYKTNKQYIYRWRKRFLNDIEPAIYYAIYSFTKYVGVKIGVNAPLFKIYKKDKASQTVVFVRLSLGMRAQKR